jgi:hypothetical protein
VAASAVLARRVDPEFPSLSPYFSLFRKKKRKGRKRKENHGPSMFCRSLCRSNLPVFIMPQTGTEITMTLPLPSILGQYGYTVLLGLSVLASTSSFPVTGFTAETPNPKKRRKKKRAGRNGRSPAAGSSGAVMATAVTGEWFYIHMAS